MYAWICNFLFYLEVWFYCQITLYFWLAWIRFWFFFFWGGGGIMNMGLILFFIVIIIRTFIRFYWRIWFELRLGFGDMVCFWEYLLWTRRVDFCIYSIWLMCKRCWALNCLAMLMIGCSLMTMIRTMWKDKSKVCIWHCKVFK